MNQPCCDKMWKLLLCFPINADCNTQDRNKLSCAAGLHFWKLSTSEMTEILVTCTLAKLSHFAFHITRLQGFHSSDICQWGSPMSLDHFQRKKILFQISPGREYPFGVILQPKNTKALTKSRTRDTMFSGPSTKNHNKYKDGAVWALQEASLQQIWLSFIRVKI